MAKQPPAPDPVVEYGESVLMGRPDIGAGVTATWTTVDGEQFLSYRGKLYVPCGHCQDGVSGSKPWHAGVFAGVCFQCGGRGYSKVLDGGPAEAAKIARRRVTNRARAERKAAEKRAAAEAAGAKFAEEHKALVDLLAPQGGLLASTDTMDESWCRGPLVDFALKVWRGEALTDKQVAFAEVMIAEQQADAAAEAERKATQRYTGEPGAKVSVTGAVVVDYFMASTTYGWASRTLYVIEGVGDDAGVTAKWVTSAVTPDGMGRGATVTITGTVKAHEEYEGTPQTVFARAKVQVITAAPVE